jgi:hypothetical protein
MSLRRRLAKVDRTLADIEKRQQLADCICKENTVAISDAKEFEAELQQKPSNRESLTVVVTSSRGRNRSVSGRKVSG